MLFISHFLEYLQSLVCIFSRIIWFSIEQCSINVIKVLSFVLNLYIEIKTFTRVLTEKINPISNALTCNNKIGLF